MFDLGFLELFIVGVIALLVLGPERLPAAARTAGQWIGNAKRITRQFSEELDRQVKADEIRERLRQEQSDIGYEDIQQNVREALDEAKKDEHLLNTRVDSQQTGERADQSNKDNTSKDADKDEPPERP